MPKNSCLMQIWAEPEKSALPICNYSQILYQFLTFTQNLKRSPYEFLNALFDILIKSLPIFIWMLSSNNNLYYGENAIQKGMRIIMEVIGSFIGGILGYFIILFMIQIFKLFFCTYKRVNIHFRIFDIIIKLGKKKLFTSEDMDFLDEHEYNIRVCKNKIYDEKECAYERKEAQQEDELRRRKEQFEREKRDAEFYRDCAEAGYEDARRGDGLFTSAAEKRKRAGEDLDTADWHAKQAAYEEQRIAELERKLGK